MGLNVEKRGRYAPKREEASKIKDIQRERTTPQKTIRSDDIHTTKWLQGSPEDRWTRRKKHVIHDMLLSE
jgi:hypothetical protein